MERFIPDYKDRTVGQVEDAVNENLEFRVMRQPGGMARAYMPHQIIFAREMTLQKRMICCHPMGSGKTCSIFYAARVALKKNFVNRVIFVGPKTVIPQAREQFTTKCPGVSREVSDKCEFMTFDRFLSMIFGDASARALTFEGAMVVVDEAHHRFPNKYRAHYGIHKINTPADVSERIVDSRDEWPILKRVLHTAEMLILSTGTFVVNDVIDTIALADLISKVDINCRELTVDSNGRRVFNDGGRTKFARLTKNFFSFIDPKTQKPDKETVGTPVTVVNDDGSSFEVIVDKVKMRDWSREQGQYETIDPSFTFEVDQRSLNVQQQKRDELMRRLDVISPKHFRVIRLAGKPGVSVIYVEDVNNQGAFFYAALLKAFGFEFFSGDDDISGEKNRFTMITGKTKTKNIERILATINSDENWDGKLNKIVIITGAARDGISIFFSQRFIFAESPWHIAGYDQAAGRSIRADSHILWKIRRKLQLIGEGKTDEEAQAEVDKFKVKIHNVVNFPASIRNNRMSVSESEGINDLRRLVLCFQKKHYNASVVSLVHSNSIECKLLKHLDIAEANYTCCAKDGWLIDAKTENYNSMFLEEDADLRIQELKSVGFIQPTRVDLVRMLTMEKILETSIVKRTPAGIQCFEDSDGQSNFASYFYSLGFPEPGRPVIWNDDFYCRNSSFVHDSCSKPQIKHVSMSLEEFVIKVSNNISNSTMIMTLVEGLIKQSESNFDLIHEMFPFHVVRTEEGVIFHMFISTRKQRMSSYFKHPQVTIFEPETKTWKKFTLSNGRSGSGMGKRGSDFKRAHFIDGPSWTVVGETTKVTNLPDGIEDFVMFNVDLVANLVAEKRLFGFVVDDGDFRVMDAAGSSNNSGQLFKDLSRSMINKINNEFGWERMEDEQTVINAFADTDRLVVMQYDTVKIEQLRKRIERRKQR